MIKERAHKSREEMTINQNKHNIPHISVAPMMDWTDRHCRYFHRLISPHARLYTEMVTTGALLHGDRDRFLRFNKQEHPIAAQLGGDNPQALAECAKICEDYGYDEVNLNCGCPSDRVQNGNFGACLMSQPELVAECVSAMIAATNIPITVKCRIAIDEYEELPFLNKYIEEVSNAGCETFIIHARKAWLNGLSPKENRDIPPLRYDIVEEIKKHYPKLEIIVNGGIKTLNDTQKHLNSFDGVMIGREFYQNPYFLAEIEQNIYKNHEISSRIDVARAMIPYIEQQNRDYGTPVKSVTRHMIGLFHEQIGSRQWRRYISENAHKDGATARDIIENALSAMQDSAERTIKAA
jgi:tRNA-dihydrouridine synthase A